MEDISPSIDPALSAQAKPPPSANLRRLRTYAAVFKASKAVHNQHFRTLLKQHAALLALLQPLSSTSGFIDEQLEDATKTLISVSEGDSWNVFASHIQEQLKTFAKHGLVAEHWYDILFMHQQCMIVCLSKQDVDGSTWAEVMTTNNELVRYITDVISHTAISEDQLASFNPVHQPTVENPAAMKSQMDDLKAQHQHFAYVITHDLSAPLRAIEGFSKLLQKGLGEQLKGDESYYLKTIEEKASTMKQLIEDVRTYAEVNRNPVRPVHFNAAQAVSEVALKFQPALKHASIEHLIAPGITLFADRDKFKLALAHLIENALKFSKDSVANTVQIVHDMNQDKHRFSVIDQGVGFDPKYQHKLFKLFQRLHSAKAFRGNGLGLALVDIIARQHGGTVSATSSPEETRFSFSISFNRPPP